MFDAIFSITKSFPPYSRDTTQGLAKRVTFVLLGYGPKTTVPRQRRLYVTRASNGKRLVTIVRLAGSTTAGHTTAGAHAGARCTDGRRIGRAGHFALSNGI